MQNLKKKNLKEQGEKGWKLAGKFSLRRHGKEELRRKGHASS